MSLSWRLVRGVLAAHRGRRRVVIDAATGRARAAGAVTEVLLAQSCKTSLLGDGVDVGANDEGHQVEEGHPSVFGQELLGKGQADGAGDPGHTHDLPEADTDGGADLVVCAGTGNQGHGRQVDGVLDGGDLYKCISMVFQVARVDVSYMKKLVCYLQSGCSRGSA